MIHESSRRFTAVIQARMSSARLPGKVLMPVLGQPILLLTIERILRCKMIDRVIVATSGAPNDDAIESICIREKVPVFRGEQDDVLDRLYRCMDAFGLNPLIRFTADNPLIDPDVCDGIIHYFLDHEGAFDYVSNNHPPTYPDGLEIEVIPRSIVETAWREADQPFQREHGSPFIWDNPERFRIGNVALTNDQLHAERWTLDYLEDYLFVKRVFEELYPVKADFRMNDVLDLLERKPEIRTINAKYAGVTWYSEHDGKLQTVKGIPTRVRK